MIKFRWIVGRDTHSREMIFITKLKKNTPDYARWLQSPRSSASSSLWDYKHIPPFPGLMPFMKEILEMTNTEYRYKRYRYKAETLMASC